MICFKVLDFLLILKKFLENYGLLTNNLFKCFQKCGLHFLYYSYVLQGTVNAINQRFSTWGPHSTAHPGGGGGNLNVLVGNALLIDRDFF